MTDRRLSPHFLESEFECPCDECRAAKRPPLVHTGLLIVLEDLRAYLGGKALSPTSGFRCTKHNASLPGSSPNSQHLLGKAADLPFPGDQAETVRQVVEKMPYAELLGLGVYNWGVHVDVRGMVNGRGARWDRRSK